jgi:hypothetical protein
MKTTIPKYQTYPFLQATEIDSLDQVVVIRGSQNNMPVRMNLSLLTAGASSIPSLNEIVGTSGKNQVFNNSMAQFFEAPAVDYTLRYTEIRGTRFRAGEGFDATANSAVVITTRSTTYVGVTYAVSVTPGVGFTVEAVTSGSPVVGVPFSYQVIL